MRDRTVYFMESPHCLIEEDLFDDFQNQACLNGPKKPSTLRARFSNRLSTLVDANVQLSEAKDDCLVSIAISRHSESKLSRVEVNQQLQEFVNAMGSSLCYISRNPHGKHPFRSLCILLTVLGPDYAQAKDDLWTATLKYARLNTRDVVEKIQQSFKKN